MVKYKNWVFTILVILFLIFSFYPTIFEISKKDKLADTRREFILEHNYYWPDYNLYLSKIRQGIQGQFTAVEKYTSEIHQGSLIQEFYVVLGWLGKILNLDPNSSYLFGRIILAPFLLIIIFLLVRYYFHSFMWQIMAFLITVVSGSFPRIFTDPQGINHIGRFMEWWSNIDALQRITFIPHILFAQIVSFYLLYHLAIKQLNNVTMKQLIIYILLGNIVGLTFPPSLITLDSILILLLLINIIKNKKQFIGLLGYCLPAQAGVIGLFVLLTLPSLLYIFITTHHLPWSALIEFHRTHPMMIPFDQYILGTGPIFFLGLAGAIISIIKRDKKFQPLIFWILATFGFATFFSVIKDQSPLRFTQTGLFIPLGLLGSYFFYQLWKYITANIAAGDAREGSQPKMYRSVGILERQDPQIQIKEISLAAFIIILSFYILGSLFIMKTSLDWQLDWIGQRVQAFNPDVPYPPQSMYPIREWMDGIRWLKNNTKSDDVVLAEITAANHIPAYSGNIVYWGQSNTVDYDRKEKEVDKFFSGKMSENEAQLFLKNGRIKYIFFSVQEKEKAGGKNLDYYYQFILPAFHNNVTNIYAFRN